MPRQGAPIYGAKACEVRASEVERSAKEQDGLTPMIYLPESASIAGVFTEVEQFAVQIHMAEAECAILGYDKFLVHRA